MRRRTILAEAGSLLRAALSFPAPAIAQGRRHLKMVTDWPKALPGRYTSAARLAETIGAVTGGRIEVRVFAAGTLVRPFATSEAVGAGLADMFHAALSYFEKTSPAFIGATEDLSRKIHESYQQFRGLTLEWNDIAERAFLNARALAWTPARSRE